MRSSFIVQSDALTRIHIAPQFSSPSLAPPILPTCAVPNLPPGALLLSSVKGKRNAGLPSIHRHQVIGIGGARQLVYVAARFEAIGDETPPARLRR